MGSIDKVTNSSTRLLFNTRALALETSLRENIKSFKALVLDVEKIQHELETCEAALATHRELCEGKKCSSSKMYEKNLEIKSNIIQLAVETAIKMNETRNLSMINQLLKILCGDVNINMLTPPKEENKENIATPKKSHKEAKSNSPTKKRKSISPKKELNMSTEDVSFKDESVSEIDGTPGRTSPIIQTKKLKSSSSISSLSGASTDSRDKKKCSDSWETPEPKQIKLCYPSPKRIGRGKTYRQARLSLVASKTCSVVDLTCSPELSGSGTSRNQFTSDQDLKVPTQNPHVQLLIKKESSDNDDTILPSPTSSGPTDTIIFQTTLKDNQKFKKPLSLLRVKAEVDEASSPIIQFVDKKPKHTTKDEEAEPLEDSINVLKRNRFANSPRKLIKSERSPVDQKPSPKKEPLACPTSVKRGQPVDAERAPVEDDTTLCEDSSMSILQHVHKLEQRDSPVKRPLAEIQNIAEDPSNLEPAIEPPSDIGDGRNAQEDKNKRKVFEVIEPIYKEPTVRKKAEKLALPGWCCDECKNFFGNLYSDDPAKLAEMIARCSKHRGRSNPARPATPPGFWHPRWDVPGDTEEFNRRNDAQ